MAFTKSIASEWSRDITFAALVPTALIWGPNPNQYPESYPNPILNPNPTEKWNPFSLLAEYWSRDHLKAVFHL